MTLGYHFFDSCSNPRKAIKNVLQILSGPGVTVPNYSCRKKWRLAGIIGDQSSITTLPISRLLAPYMYPVEEKAQKETPPLQQLRINPQFPDVKDQAIRVLRDSSTNGTPPTQLPAITYSEVVPSTQTTVEADAQTLGGDFPAELRLQVQELSKNVATVARAANTMYWVDSDMTHGLDTDLSIIVSNGQPLPQVGYKEISYGAVDEFLGHRQHFPHFFRTIRSEYAISYSLGKLIEHFGWTWVGIITSNDDSGERESYLLTRFLLHFQVCVAFIFRNSLIKDDSLRANHELVEHFAVKVVILCGTYHDLIVNPSVSKWLNNVTIILTPSWGPNIVLIEKYPEIFNGSLSLDPLSKRNAQLKRFIDGFCPANYPGDMLVEDLWMILCRCISGKKDKDLLYEKTYGISLHNCTGQERIKDSWNYLNDEVYDPVTNAVFIMVSALHLIHSSQNNWSRTDASYRLKIVHTLKHLNLGGGVFTEYGDLLDDYQIYNHIIVNQTLYSSVVGYIQPNILHHRYESYLYINDSLIQWKTINNEKPKSQCTKSCLPGSRKVSGNSIYFCCYGCISCSEGEISNSSDNENCRRCPDYEWSNEKKTQCVPKLVEFLSYSDEGISLIALSGSVLLFIVTAVILGIFIRYQDTPIVRANNKNLSFVLLVSIMLSFLCVFLFLGRPVDSTCMLRQISTVLLLSISISLLLAKTIMVYIAFKATKPGSVWRTWTGVKLPNCVLLICSSVQVVICMSWVTLCPPFQELDTQSYTEKIIVQCNEGSDLWFYSVLGYMGILAAVSFITAFLARTLPDSFNEAKYITFSMLVFCSVWLAMIPAYLSTKGKYMVAVEIFAILTSNAGLVGCIFFPKCYIILCKPERNTKSYIMSRTA
ncbi:vomeronasal type-2 receptor 26-like [Anomaloglossus baeobatrachus]|uniref:vomeronasal type-2 receptor 26-like n=1 Tax=Anomaloglossus baeobatrachus TaxID=238106 RepID=UPI003F4FD836